MNKAQLRRRLRQCLLSMPSEQRKRKSKKACQHLVATSLFQEASMVMLFLSLYYEVDTTDAIQQAWTLGKTVVVPKVDREQGLLIPIQINSLDEAFDFTAGISGLRNPTSNHTVPLEQIDLVVAPGLGFDGQGNRLGHGGGYYDRFFSTGHLRAKRCGFAFDEQVVDCIPVDKSDQLVDYLVTDEQALSVFSRA